MTRNKNIRKIVQKTHEVVKHNALYYSFVLSVHCTYQANEKIKNFLILRLKSEAIILKEKQTSSNCKSRDHKYAGTLMIWRRGGGTKFLCSTSIHLVSVPHSSFYVMSLFLTWVNYGARREYQFVSS